MVIMKKHYLLLVLFMLVIIGVNNGQARDISVSLPSGSYNKDQIVVINHPGETSVFITFGGNRQEIPVIYSGPFNLSALPGEQRIYDALITTVKDNIETGRYQYRWIIDKKYPASPIINPEPGYYSRDISLSFSETEKDDVYFSINGRADTVKKWDGNAIRLAARKGQITDYSVFAYSKDSAGNISKPKVFVYRLGLEEKAILDVPILSPRPGDYKNPQLLAIDTEGFVWVKYLIGRGDPIRDGSDYVAPVEIRSRGNVLLTVAAMPFNSDKPIIKNVSYNVEQKEEVLILPSYAQGIYSADLPVSISAEGYYTFDYKNPSESDIRYNDPIQLKGVESGVRIVSISFKEKGNQSNYYYRWTYVLDRRVPIIPQIVLDSAEPIKEDTFASFQGSKFSQIYYTLDGSTPDRNTNRYSFPFRISIPQSGAGSIMVRAVAISPSGIKSNELTTILQYDREVPNPPKLIYLGQGKEPGNILINLEPELGCSLIYEMTLDGTIPQDPNQESEYIEKSINVSLPYGMERVFTFKFSSIDKAGNVSQPADPVRFFIDRLPPSKPVVRIENNTAVITGDDIIYYTLSSEENYPPLPSRSSLVYTQPIVLSGKEGEVTKYSILARSIDPAGNIGPLSGPHIYSVDLRKPELPLLAGIADGSYYSTSAVLHLIDNYSDIHYAYTTDGTEPNLESGKNIAKEGPLLFNGQEGMEILYKLKLQPVFRGISGEIKELSFTIDRKPPIIPMPEGFINGSSYRNPITVRLPAEDNVTLYCLSDYSKEALGREKLFTDNNIWNKPRVFAGEPGKSVTYYLRFGAKDKAGNITENPEIYCFTVNQSYLPLPAVKGLPADGVSSETVELFLLSPHEIRYELTIDGTMPKLPSQASSLYRDKLILPAHEGKEIFYSLYINTFSSEGLSSEKPIFLQVLIDRKPPPPPNTPKLLYDGTSGAVTLWWEDKLEEKIFYSINNESWKEYKDPVPLKETSDISFYSSDRAGNRSIVKKERFNIPEIPSRLVTGVVYDGLYNRGILLNPANSEIVLRYEIGTAHNPPQDPDSTSPLLREPVLVDTAEGETAEFIVKIKSFLTLTDSFGSSAETYRFRIDRTPPEAPVLVGAADGASYQTDKIVSFSATNNQIYYALVQDESSPSANQFRRYSDPLSLRTPVGRYGLFRILAYSLDDAGNRSPLREWRISIDKAIVYVSTEGEDSNDGTRARPLRSLSRALEVLKRTGKQTVYLSSGSYFINSTLILEGNISIVGGFSADQWTRDEKNNTLLIPSPRFSSGSALIESRNSDIVLKDITLSDAETLTPLLFDQIGGRLTLEKVYLARKGGNTARLMQIRNGELTLRDCNLEVNSSGNVIALSSEGSKLLLIRTTLKTDNIAENTVLLDLRNKSHISLTDSFIHTGTGRIINPIRITDSELVMERSELACGAGAMTSTGIISSKSSLSIRDSNIYGNSAARITTCLSVTDSSLTLMRSQISADSAIGATAVKSENSNINITLSQIKGGSAKEFIYLFSLRNSKADFLTNLISTSDTEDISILDSEGSSVRFYNNSVILKNGIKNTLALKVRNPLLFSFINNILIGTGPNLSAQGIVYQGGTDQIEILTNNISGFVSLMVINGIQSRNALEMNKIDGDDLGGYSHGNISQGVNLTFSDSSTMRLNPNFPGIDAGTDVRNRGGLNRDWEGKIRPNTAKGARPVFDIGAYEY